MTRRKNKKGILLTLLVVVLFVLMLGEVITYIVINVNYNTLVQSATSASSQGGTASLITAASKSLLHSSLSAALGTLTGFEANPGLRQTILLNDTPYMLESLMTNGTVYGINLESAMGGAIMDNLTNSIKPQLSNQGLSLTIEYANLSVYQTSPSYISATYKAVMLLNGSSGSIMLPIKVTTGIPLNGTSDLLYAEQGVSNPLSIRSQYPAAAQIGNGNAIKGSGSPFMFTSGTVVVEGGTPSCSGIPSGVQSQSFILVLPDAINIPQGVCGMGGLVTETLGTTPLVPYLVYPSSSNIFNVIQNGTQVLLDGPGLSVLNTTSLQSAIQNGYYYNSTYLPPYIYQQQPQSQALGGGLFSFNLLNRYAPYFSTTTGVYSNVLVTAANGITLPAAFTISFWVNKNKVFSNSGNFYCGGIINIGSSNVVIYARSLQPLSCNGPGTGAAGTTYDMPLTFRYTNSVGTLVDNLNSPPTPPSEWVQAAAVFGQNTLTWYIDGNMGTEYNGLIDPPALGSSTLLIGAGNTRSFNGSITNVQIYDAPLSGQMLQNLFGEGINGAPVISANLIAWYPLNSNANDYGSYAHNGIANDVSWQPISGYFGDPIYQSTPYAFDTETVDGVMGCTDPDTCTSTGLQHLYISGLGLVSSGGSQINESAALNLSSAIFPQVMAFNGSAYMNQSKGFAWMESGSQSFTFSIWVYPTSQNGVVVDEEPVSGATQDTFISLSSGTVKVGFEGSSGITCTSVGSAPLNEWTNIIFTYTGGSTSATGYIDGVGTTGSVSARAGQSSPLYYALGRADSSNNCGASAGFNGLMANYQVYSSALTAAQALQLYLNNSVSGVTANAVWPLNGPGPNGFNTTSELVSGNTGNLYRSPGTVCSAANVINFECAEYYVP